MVVIGELKLSFVLMLFLGADQYLIVLVEFVLIKKVIF